jgi:hypothetical protein
MASAINDPAPRAEPALPALSRVAAITGAASGVLIVATNGFNPRSRSWYPPTFAWPNAAPCFFFPYTRRSNESTSTNVTAPAPGSNLV